MQADSPMRSVAALEADSDRAVLTVLLDSPGLWAAEEVQREMSDPVEAENSLARLYAAGLVHRLDGGFVFASRTARQADALYQG
jgi:hypothetical protein